MFFLPFTWLLSPTLRTRLKHIKDLLTLHYCSYIIMVQTFNIHALLFQNKLHQCKIWESVQKKPQCYKFLKYLSSLSHMYWLRNIFLPLVSPIPNITQKKDEDISCFYTKHKPLTRKKNHPTPVPPPKTTQVKTICSPPSQPSSSFNMSPLKQMDTTYCTNMKLQAFKLQNILKIFQA